MTKNKLQELKIVFFGTPDFAKKSLESIYESRHQVVGVVTTTDKASGRGQKINESSVKKYALEKALPLFQPEKLKNQDFWNQMRTLNADVFVVVAFRMMPQELFSIPRMGSFNLHASLLPDYRGAAPINHVLINGENETGVTTFFINEKIDEGNILLQEKIDILPKDDAGSLHDKLMEKGAKLVIKTLDGLSSGLLKEKPQQQNQNLKYAPKIFKKDTSIDWNKKGNEVHNFIRGLSPCPGAFTSIPLGAGEKIMKIYKGSYEKKNHDTSPGSVDLSRNAFKIYTTDGVYFPTEIQPEGKKRMNTQDFLNGLQSMKPK